jgi:hypothetical protein
MHLFAAFPAQKPGRVVLLGSPLKGSSLARRLSGNPLLRPFLGRAIEHGLLGDAPRWKGGRPLAMVAGTAGFGMGSLLMRGTLPQPHDGTVALRETDTPEINCHLQVPYSHFFMLFADPVAQAVCRFLREGELAG